MMTLQYPHVKIVVLIHDTLTPDVEEALLHIADQPPYIIQIPE